MRLLLALVVALVPSWTRADADAPRLARQVCAACHGAHGNSSRAEVPSLAGQGEAYLRDQLRQFAAQGGRRASGVMGAIAVNLSPAQMDTLADWFAHQRLEPRPTSVLHETAAAGEAIWFGGLAERRVAACASCHGLQAMGAPAAYPRLAGQRADYVARQLRQFRSGRRASDASAQMRDIAARLSDAEIDALASYVARLPQGTSLARAATTP